jgi:mRNA interferase YafQ
MVIQKTIALLAEKGIEAIPEKMNPHKLVGNYSGTWECHIFPDLLLIWEQTENPKEIYLILLGSHSELF